MCISDAVPRRDVYHGHVYFEEIMKPTIFELFKRSVLAKLYLGHKIKIRVSLALYLRILERVSVAPVQLQEQGRRARSGAASALLLFIYYDIVQYMTIVNLLT